MFWHIVGCRAYARLVQLALCLRGTVVIRQAQQNCERRTVDLWLMADYMTCGFFIQSFRFVVE